MSYRRVETPISNSTPPNEASEQPDRRPRLLDEVRSRLRLKHDSLRTEQAYLYWVRRSIRATGAAAHANSMARRRSSFSTTRHGMAWHGMAWRGVARAA
jgi:hypothetical protein